MTTAKDTETKTARTEAAFGEKALKAASEGQKAAANGPQRDLKQEPYDAQETRVGAFLERLGIEPGLDPIGLLMSAYAEMSATRG